jgi:hypothetical protein
MVINVKKISEVDYRLIAIVLGLALSLWFGWWSTGRVGPMLVSEHVSAVDTHHGLPFTIMTRRLFMVDLNTQTFSFYVDAFDPVGLLFNWMFWSFIMTVFLWVLRRIRTSQKKTPPTARQELPKEVA